MTKDVLVSISGLQMDVLEPEESANEPIEVITPAIYYFKNGKHFLFYDQMEAGSASTTKNKIKITSEELMEISISGEASVNMSFEKGKKTITYYYTPFGQLLLGIHTRDMKIDVDNDNINVKISYLLEVNHQPLADCEIKMNIKPKYAKDFDLNELMEF